MKFIRLITNCIRLTSRIVLVFLILSSTSARGSEDKIVFVSKRNGTPEVFLVEGLNGKPIQLTRNRFASWPTISPDGKEVVFVSQPPHGISNIFKLHIAKGKIEILTHNGKSNIAYSDLDWSPDGRQLLFLRIIGALEGEKTDLCVMDMMTRDIQHILQTATGNYIGQPSWSPDSQHILYAVDHDLPRQLGLRALLITDDNGNRVKRLEQDLTPIESLQRQIVPTWSPRRSEIAYFGLVVVDDTNQPPPNPYHIYSMNLNDEMVTALTSGGAENRTPKAWRPDGQKILLTISSPIDEEVRRSDFYVMDPNGENMINLNLAQSSEAGAAWSPDGRQITFSRGLNMEEVSIFVADADGQNQQRLTFERGWDLAPHWSPNGDKIAYRSIRDGTQRIYTVNTNGQNVQQITHRRRKYYTPPAWSPDGRRLAFGAGDARSWGIYLIDPQGNNETLIIRTDVSEFTGLARVSRPTWSPDGQHLIYIDPEHGDDAGLMKIRVDGGMPAHLKTEELRNWHNPVWSPDGNSLLFSAREEREPFDVEVAGAIFLINLHTSESRHFILPDPSIVESDGYISRLVWAPDGLQLMLSMGPDLEGQGVKSVRRLYLIDIASETVRLWMDDATEADWVRPGFTYAVNPRGKHIATWAELKKTEAR